MTFSAVGVPLDHAELEARPERFVAAARELATATGSAGFTVTQVTGTAGLSLKAFYRCFRGKDDLLLALLAADSEIGAAILAERIGGRTGPEAVRTYVVELFAMLDIPGARGYAGVLVREYLRLVEHHEAELHRALRPLFDLLARHLGTGHPHRGDPARDARTMFGVLLGGIHEVVVGRVTDTAELAAYLHRFCTMGVG